MVTIGAFVAAFGALGGIIALCVFIAGFAVGWWMRGQSRHVCLQTERGPHKETERERRQREEQEAFDSMMHYNADDAYGLRAGDR